MYRGRPGEPPVLVCQVGHTEATTSGRRGPARLAAGQGDWVALGAADEKKPAADGTVEAWGRSPTIPIGGWYGLRKGYRGRFGMYLPPLLEALGLAEVTHDARNNSIRAHRSPRRRSPAPATHRRSDHPVTKVIRYRTKPEHADENDALVRGRLRRAGRARTPGTALRHVPSRRRRELPPSGRLDGEVNPLTTSAAFAAFQAGIADRVAEGPDPADATAIGS